MLQKFRKRLSFDARSRMSIFKKFAEHLLMHFEALWESIWKRIWNAFDIVFADFVWKSPKCRTEPTSTCTCSWLSIESPIGFSVLILCVGSSSCSSSSLSLLILLLNMWSYAHALAHTRMYHVCWRPLLYSYLVFIFKNMVVALYTTQAFLTYPEAYHPSIQHMVKIS